jgi:hypothetical protein
MSYDYQTERPKLFTEEGQIMFLKVRDNAKRLLLEAGAFRSMEVLRVVTGDSWTQMACIDRLVELKEIVEIQRSCWAQYKVYSTPEVNNY